MFCKNMFNKITGRGSRQLIIPSIETSGVDAKTESDMRLSYWEEMIDSGDSVVNVMEVAEDKTRICGMSPLTGAGKKMQMAKMMLLTLAPITALCIMCITNLSTIARDNDGKKNVRDMIKFSLETATVIHNLQRERDMTALYLSTLGAETRMFLRERYPDTDSSFEQLNFWPTNQDEAATSSQFNTKLGFLKYIQNHRAYLEAETTDAYKEIAFYSNAIKIFIDWMYDSIQKSRDGEIWRLLVAYQLLLACKEDLGVERTLGGVFFSTGSFETQEHYLWYLEKHNVGAGNWRNARRFSSDLQINFDKEMKNYKSSNFSFHIKNMRKEIGKNNLTGREASWERSTFWFDNMTIYIDILFGVQKKLADEVLESLDNSIQRDTKGLTVSIGVFVLVGIICPMVIIFVKAIISDMQRYANILSEQTQSYNLERKRTNSLLFQMLPKIVAERLQKGEHVIAESYTEATIYFSDFAGFTKAVINLSPEEMVLLLNNVYVCMDARISEYDVYKVENVGDAYMITSGIPQRNGRKHIAEIASMALDLLHHVSHVNVPNSSTKLQIRSGVHTGPCVAGVVGRQMPRYCLLGQTVNIASKMESTGAPNKIHVSGWTYDALRSENKFILEQTSDIEIVGRGPMRAYWLLEKTGFLESLTCMPECQTDAQRSMADPVIKIHSKKVTESVQTLDVVNLGHLSP